MELRDLFIKLWLRRNPDVKKILNNLLNTIPVYFQKDVIITYDLEEENTDDGYALHVYIHCNNQKNYLKQWWKWNSEQFDGYRDILKFRLWFSVTHDRPEVDHETAL